MALKYELQGEIDLANIMARLPEFESSEDFQDLVKNGNIKKFEHIILVNYKANGDEKSYNKRFLLTENNNLLNTTNEYSPQAVFNKRMEKWTFYDPTDLTSNFY